MGIEQRKYNRLQSSIPIHYWKYPIVEGDRGVESTISKDISGGGILFGSAEEFILGDLVKLEIDLPGWKRFFQHKGFYRPGEIVKDGPLVVLGIVVRVLKERNGYLIGVSFEGIDEDHREALIDYISRHSHKK